MIEATWLEIANRELGINERDNPDRIVEYFNSVNYKGLFTKIRTKHGMMNWCSAFACFCLESAGVKSPKSVAAIDFLNWGVSLSNIRFGSILVFHTGDPKSWKGHVAFALEINTSGILCLGGNQRDCVKVSTYKIENIRKNGIRWPIGVSLGIILS